MFNTRRDILFLILAGFFITNAFVGELIGGKLIIAICLTPMIYFGHFLVRRRRWSAIKTPRPCAPAVKWRT